MPSKPAPALLRAMSWALQTLVIALVVMWVIDVPGMLDLGIYTEQFIAATLGGSPALVFLLFPLKRDGGGLAGGCRIMPVPRLPTPPAGISRSFTRRWPRQHLGEGK